MVKKSFLVLIVLLFTFTTLFANSAVYKQADDLFWSDRYEEGKMAEKSVVEYMT